jgi:hypothetical protein
VQYFVYIFNIYFRPPRWPRHTLYPQKSALTLPTNDCRSVGIVRSQTEATEFSSVLLLFYFIYLLFYLTPIFFYPSMKFIPIGLHGPLRGQLYFVLFFMKLIFNSSFVRSFSHCSVLSFSNVTQRATQFKHSIIIVTVTDGSLWNLALQPSAAFARRVILPCTHSIGTMKGMQPPNCVPYRDT